MLKKLLLLWLVLWGAYAAHAQVYESANVEVLNTLYEKYDEEYQATRAKILEMANQPGWDRPDLASNGMVFGVKAILPNGYILVNEIDNNRDAANTTRASSLWTGGSLGLNLNGEGMRVGVWEAPDIAPNGQSVSAILPTHVELNGRVTIRDQSPLQGGAGANHGVHVAGTIAATGLSANAKGMASAALIDSYDSNNDDSEMAQAAANGLVLSNHSYGFRASQAGFPDNLKGAYAQGARNWDEIAFNAPNYVIVKSAGNDGSAGINTVFGNGYNIVTGNANSKNILVVGAANIIANGYQQPSDVVIASFSSRGPTDDGRIKPDIVGAGVNLYSPIGNTNTSYGFLSGTSMSAPNVSGSIALLQQHWRATLGGGSTFPRSATVRGLLIHTADEAGTAPGPDYIFGYGMVNIERAVRMVSSVQAADGRNIIQQNSLSNGGNLSLNVVASGTEPLKVTICWNDPPPPTNILNQGTPILNDFTAALVSDLDVRITDNVTTTITQPWVMPYQLDQNARADVATQVAQRGDNTRDNVEQIVITNTVPGRSYTINITHKGTLSNPQQYTLIASGVGGTAVAASGATDNNGARIDNVTLSGTGINNTNTAGCTTYTDFTGLAGTTAVGSGQSLNLSVTLGTCGTNADKHARVYIDWNGDGDFVDAGEQVAQSTAAVNGTGVATLNTSSITVPGNVTTNGLVLMRVVCVETTDVNTITPTGSYTRGETEDYLIRFTAPVIDVGVTDVVTPNSNAICSGNQPILVRIRNFGSQAQSNIPVTINVTGTSTATLNATFTGSIPAYGQGWISVGNLAVANSGTYNLSAVSSLAGDGNAANNTRLVTLTTGAQPTISDRSASSCAATSPTDQVSLRGTINPATNNAVTWHTQASGGNLLAVGNQSYVNKSLIDGLPTSNTVFAAVNDINFTNVGPATGDLGASSTGSYAQAAASPVFNVTIPFTIASARMYISESAATTLSAPTGTVGAQAGFVTFNVLDQSTGEIVSTSIVPVTYTDGNGAVFPVNIAFPRAGNFILAIAYNGNFNIWRNNAAVPANLYPILIGGANGVGAITGTTATPGGAGFYYWFYNMTIAPSRCPSATRLSTTIANTGGVTATLTQGTTPITFFDVAGSSVTLNATQTGAGLSYTWQRRDITLIQTNPFVDIPNSNSPTFVATRQSPTPLASGSEIYEYRVVITSTATGCRAFSPAIQLTLQNGSRLVTNLSNVVENEQDMWKLYPNPTEDYIQLDFVSQQTNAQAVIVDIRGTLYGEYALNCMDSNCSQRIEVAKLPAGLYYLQVKDGDNLFVKAFIKQ